MKKKHVFFFLKKTPPNWIILGPTKSIPTLSSKVRIKLLQEIMDLGALFHLR